MRGWLGVMTPPQAKPRHEIKGGWGGTSKMWEPIVKYALPVLKTIDKIIKPIKPNEIRSLKLKNITKCCKLSITVENHQKPLGP